MTDVLYRTQETLLPPRLRSEADIATGELPVTIEELAQENAAEPKIQDPDTLRDVTMTAGWFRGEIDRLRRMGKEVPRGTRFLAQRASSRLLGIASLDENEATDMLRTARDVTEELTQYVPWKDEAPMLYDRVVTIDGVPSHQLPNGQALVQSLGTWLDANTNGDPAFRESVEWTCDDLRNGATESRLRDGAFLLAVIVERDQNSPS